jgi:hypothetical protein
VVDLLINHYNIFLLIIIISTIMRMYFYVDNMFKFVFSKAIDGVGFARIFIITKSQVPALSNIYLYIGIGLYFFMLICSLLENFTYKLNL